MSSQTTDNNKRLDYLDVAKGIGILLVILGALSTWKNR